MIKKMIKKLIEEIKKCFVVIRLVLKISLYDPFNFNFLVIDFLNLPEVKLVRNNLIIGSLLLVITKLTIPEYLDIYIRIILLISGTIIAGYFDIREKIKTPIKSFLRKCLGDFFFHLRTSDLEKGDLEYSKLKKYKESSKIIQIIMKIHFELVWFFQYLFQLLYIFLNFFRFICDKNPDYYLPIYYFLIFNLIYYNHEEFFSYIILLIILTKLLIYLSENSYQEIINNWLYSEATITEKSLKITKKNIMIFTFWNIRHLEPDLFYKSKMYLDSMGLLFLRIKNERYKFSQEKIMFKKIPFDFKTKENSILWFIVNLNFKVKEKSELPFILNFDWKDDLFNSILVSSLFLIFFKFFFYFIAGTPPPFLNLSLYLLFTIFSYHFDAILYLKKYYFFYIYSKIIPPESTSRVCNFYIRDPDDAREYVLEQEAVKDLRRPFREEFFEKILTLLNLFRLFVLSEPYMFFIFRFILFYFLIFNGLYFLTLSLTLLFIVSKFLFHFSDFSDYCYRSVLIQMREQENYIKEFPNIHKDYYIDKGKFMVAKSPFRYPLVKNPEIYNHEENPVIKPTWENASIMYYHSIRQFINESNLVSKLQSEENLWKNYSAEYNKRKKSAEYLTTENYPAWKDTNKLYEPFWLFHNAFRYTVVIIFRRETGDCLFELISRNKYFSIIWIPVIIIVTFYLCPELNSITILD